MADLAHHLGYALRRARLPSGRSQAAVGDACGLSQSAYGRLELGLGGRTPLDSWESAAHAVGLRLVAGLVPVVPVDEAEERLRRLVLDLAEQGGWSSHTSDHRSIRIARAATREAAVVQPWAIVADVEAAIQDLKDAMVLERADRDPSWRVGGLMIIGANGPNRRRMSECSEIVDVTFPSSGTAWMGALKRSGHRMPGEMAYCWASGGYTRLTPARLPLIRPRRERGSAW
jgi:transcriptional regulator with XRE-family HTH domain